VIMKAHKSDKN